MDGGEHRHAAANRGMSISYSFQRGLRCMMRHSASYLFYCEPICPFPTGAGGRAGESRGEGGEEGDQNGGTLLFVLKSCIFTGLARSGSYHQGIENTGISPGDSTRRISVCEPSACKAAARNATRTLPRCLLCKDSADVRLDVEIEAVRHLCELPETRRRSVLSRGSCPPRGSGSGGRG